MPLPTYDEWFARYGGKPPVGIEQMIAETGLPQEIIDLYSTRMLGNFAQQNGLMTDKAPDVYNLQNMASWDWAQRNGFNPQQLFGGNAQQPPAPAVNIGQRTATPFGLENGGIPPGGYSLSDVLNRDRQKTIPEFGRIGGNSMLDRVLRMRQSGY